MIESATELSKLYIEIGACGLLCVIACIFFILMAKNLIKSNKDNQDLIKQLLTTEQEKNAKLIKEIVTQVTTHTPSELEVKTANKLSETIDNQLYEFMHKVNASRVALIQYHNGTRGFSKHSFMKMSVTNEAHQSNVKPLTPVFHDQMKSLFNKGLTELDLTGEYSVENIEDIKNIDESMYWFMNERNDAQAFHLSIRNREGSPIGYLLVLYSNNNEARSTAAEIIPKMKELRKLIEFLLDENIEQ